MFQILEQNLLGDAIVQTLQYLCLECRLLGVMRLLDAAQ
jgi:hypothetical protein